MNNSGRYMLAMLAGAGIAAGFNMANPAPCTPATVESASWTLIVEREDGNRYAVDYGLTESDCRTAARDYERGHPALPVIECNDESYKP